MIADSSCGALVYDRDVRKGLMLVALAGCGDQDRCGLEPGPLPIGPLGDPYALPLPADCVRGGLVDAPGRWYVEDPTQLFYYWYPQFEGTCETGFRRAFRDSEDIDASDGDTFQTWSDGTVYFERREYSRPASIDPMAIYATAFCMGGDGVLKGVEVFTFDREMTVTRFTGTRFARKDGLARGLELVAEIATDNNGHAQKALDLAIDGGLAYVAGASGLDIIDIANPAAPVALAHAPGSFNDVVIVHGDGRTVAYLAPFAGSRTKVVDVSDPRTPVPLADLAEYSHTLFRALRDNGVSQLYLGSYAPAIPVYDVTHPLAPVRLGAVTVPGPVSGVHDMFVDGDRLYANNTSAGLVAIDISAGLDQPVELGRIASSYSHTSVVGTAGGRRVVLHGDEGISSRADGAAFLRILDDDPSSPTFLTELGRYQSRREVSIHNFQLVGDRLYIAYYQDGVRVIDLSDPTQPREVAHYNTWDPSTAPGLAFEGAFGIQVVGNLIYVADVLRGLLILRDPALPAR